MKSEMTSINLSNDVIAVLKQRQDGTWAFTILQDKGWGWRRKVDYTGRFADQQTAGHAAKETARQMGLIK